MDVAQVTANTWAISCRGFDAVQSNKLLVLIDGRTVYNPDFGGVFWDMQQDVLLEDIERIEVIRGPGGTLWGSNAVNGIISIITKNAKDTQGTYAMAGGGSQKQLLDGFRYGGKIGEDGYYRVYGKSFEWGPNYQPVEHIDDAWRQGCFGFRTDWQPGAAKNDTFTLQGDHFVGTTNDSIVPTAQDIPERQTGQNLLARWRHVIDEDSDWTLQAYYDNWSRIDSLQTENVQTLDVDFQYRFPLGDHHSITCGAGFRNVVSYFPGGDTFSSYFPTPYWTTNFPTQFVQDEISIVPDKVTFTLGCKLEENPYTGLEYQPSMRLLWTPDNKHTMWGAVTRAVHTPTRVDEQGSITQPPLSYGYPRYTGNPDLQSEALIAYEVGYRAQTTDRFSWDLATFYNTYTSLVVGRNTGYIPPPPYTIILVSPENIASGYSYGAELACNYTVSDSWRLYLQYTYYHEHLDIPPPSGSTYANPMNQVYLKSSWTVYKNVDFDLMARYVDELACPAAAPRVIPSYIEMDMRLAWRPRKYWEVALVGQNLLQPYHYEFYGGMESFPLYATEVPRGVYGTLTWRH
jgi:iron complex outermembrane receptor protein